MSTEQKTLNVAGAPEKSRAPVERKNRFFARACAPLLAAALAVGGSAMAGCRNREEYTAEEAAKIQATLAALPSASDSGEKKEPPIDNYAEYFTRYEIKWGEPEDARKCAKDANISEGRFAELVNEVIESLANAEDYEKAADVAVKYGVLEKIKAAVAERGANEALKEGVMGDSVRKIDKALADGADVNAKDDEGVTALMGAIQEEHAGMAKKLLECGAEVDAKDNDGWSALTLAILSDNKKIAKMLIDKGANVNLIVPRGRPLEVDKDSLVYIEGSLLKIAVEMGDFSMVKLLVEKGADPEARYGEGKTPLLAAAAEGNLDILKYLHARHADRKAVSEGKNAVLFAIESENLKAAEFLVKMAEVGEFDGIEELREAARLGNVELAEKLVKKGADFRETENYVFTKDGVETPLMAAAYAGKAEMVKYLLKRPWVKAIDAKDGYGRTALMMAAMNGNAKCVRLLLDAGAYKNLRDDYGKTALSHAENNGKKQAYELLLSEGAKY